MSAEKGGASFCNALLSACVIGGQRPPLSLPVFELKGTYVSLFEYECGATLARRWRWLKA
jgi:hypothetical protein